MNRSDVSFVAKVVVLSAALSALIKYGLPMALTGSQVAQNEPTLGLVIALLLTPSALMGGLFWLRRSPHF
ncbi:MULTISPECIES: hypothetical protein [Cyanophyceae]|uniref:hypothetical protein n=1 Tax=Cyanophyceae TaxID=3028117 RepID=UPI001683E141|nr:MULTISPECIES: hypothetical protein [Cyanophyceae]MBD1914461.1 hypothetical protein [Phormidium sp. FACHB-77]MBD2031034.1 hypothetical protein [Phormidium sp. FACHB-322]MBD2052133.1 hypothetical protein [Leptolyngbya sp. FACHB-60]